MTDLEKFIELYKSFGIDCIVNKYIHYQIIVLGEAGTVTDFILTKHFPKLGGYSGFYSEITFDEEGKFISQNFWE